MRGVAFVESMSNVSLLSRRSQLPGLLIAITAAVATGQAQATDFYHGGCSGGYCANGDSRASASRGEGSAVFTLTVRACAGQSGCCCWDNCGGCPAVGPGDSQVCCSPSCEDCCHSEKHQSCCSTGTGCCQGGAACDKAITSAKIGKGTECGDVAATLCNSEGECNDGSLPIGALNLTVLGGSIGDDSTLDILEQNDLSNSDLDLCIWLSGVATPIVVDITDTEKNDSSVPAASEWGLVAMTLLCLTTGTVVLMRRRLAACQHT